MLGQRDETACAHLVERFGGRLAEGEFCEIYEFEGDATTAEAFWPAVNAMAQRTPGTLAQRAISDSAVPERFRVVAPSFADSKWRVLPAPVALAEVRDLLHAGVDNETRRDELLAGRIALAFTRVFGNDAIYLCNQQPDAPDMGARSTGSWSVAAPLTPAYAERGVVGIGGGRIGMLWFTAV